MKAPLVFNPNDSLNLHLHSLRLLYSDISLPVWFINHQRTEPAVDLHSHSTFLYQQQRFPNDPNIFRSSHSIFEL